VSEPRTLDAVQDLLDLQINDRDDRPVGRVEDLEMDESAVPRPVLTAVLSGGPALAARFDGRLGAWLKGLYRRFHDEKEAQPLRIGAEQIRHVNSRVDLVVSIDELGIGRLDRWIVDSLLGRIPGADVAPQ
jgi:hypothetical protein